MKAPRSLGSFGRAKSSMYWVNLNLSALYAYDQQKRRLTISGQPCVVDFVTILPGTSNRQITLSSA
jgi:hypothetical protein